MQAFFVSGIGTGIGKTFVSAILSESLRADYWKPVQAGFENGTDNLTVRQLISNPQTVIHPETYLFKLPASPHIAAREENIRIDCSLILDQFKQMKTNRPLIIEGAGGLLVPLNDSELMIDLAKKLEAKLILVSRNYLGSINHSLLTAESCRHRGLDVCGWVFNYKFMNYESDIVSLTGIPAICSIPFIRNISRESVRREAVRVGDRLTDLLLGAPARAQE